jgi:hypothetical protein
MSLSAFELCIPSISHIHLESRSEKEAAIVTVGNNEKSKTNSNFFIRVRTM